MTRSAWLEMYLIAEMLAFNPTIRDHYQIWQTVQAFESMLPAHNNATPSAQDTYDYTLAMSRAMGQYGILAGARNLNITSA